MNDTSDIDRLHAQVAFLKMRAKPTNELLFIWAENNHTIWSKEDFDAIQKVLLERQVQLPKQQKEKSLPEEKQRIRIWKNWADNY